MYCHLHSNMAATIVVAPNRWAARADGHGAFTLKDVPAGTYTVVAWHKTAGTFRKTITIGEQGDAEVNFTLPYVEPPGAKPCRAQVNMRFATRTFLSSFVPFAVLLAVSFWAIRASVIATVRDGLRASVRDNQVALAREQARNEARNRKLLQGIAENPTLRPACNCWRPSAACGTGAQYRAGPTQRNLRLAEFRLHDGFRGARRTR